VTTDWRRLHPLTPWLRGWALTAVIAGFFLNSLRDSYEETRQLGRLAGVWGLIIIIAFVIIIATTYNVIWWLLARFRIGRETVDLTTGILAKRHRSLRLDQLEAVDIVRPFIASRLGLAELKLESAGGADSQLSLVYLKASYAEEVRAEILSRKSTSMESDGSCEFAQKDGNRGYTHPQDDGDGGFTPAPTTSPCAPVAASLSTHDSESGLPLFTVPPSWTIRSYLRTWEPWGSLLATIGIVVATITLDSYTGFFALLPFVYAMFRTFWRHIVTEMRFTGYAREDAILLSHGLTTQVKQTIPAKRIQAVRLTQRLWWRKPNWWRVEANIAGYAMGDESSPRTVLAPVADPGLAKRALGLVMPDITSPEVWELAIQVMGSGTISAPFIGSPRRARLFDPWTWSHQGYVRSDFALIIRTGRVTRRVTIIPHDRVQGISVMTGVWSRARDLATVLIHSTPGPASGQLNHLSTLDTGEFLATQTPLIANVTIPVESNPAQ
jgi:putative membrane protein